MKKDKEMYCGSCCWFYGECTDGYGFCSNKFAEMTYCGDECIEPSEYVSIEQMRHHMAVLLQAYRFIKDENLPPIYVLPDLEELGKAIDFSVNYIKTFSKL